VGFRETKFDESTAVSYNLNINDGPVDIKFFAGGKTNMAYNCLDRHILAGNGDKVAFYWEGNSVGEQTACVSTHCGPFHRSGRRCCGVRRLIHSPAGGSTSGVG